MTIYYNRAKDPERYSRRISRLISSTKKFLLIPIAGMLLLMGCEEDPSKIGSGILPPSDFSNLEATDTFSIKSYTRYLDTLESFRPTYSYLGNFFSPYFGITAGGFVTQLWLYGEWPETGRSFDSLDLKLRIVNVLGETPGTDVINIWEVDEFMHFDSTYYSSRDVPKKQLLGSFSLEGLEDRDTTLTLRMSQTFMDELTRDTTMFYLDEDTIDFRNFFNGLYFEYPQSSNYHMFRIDLVGGSSSMELHYTDTAGFARKYYFLFNTKTVYYNTYHHDYDAADPDKKIKYLNLDIEDTVSYVQGFNGVFTTLKIPGLEELKARMPIGINKARLYIPAYIDDVNFPEEMAPTELLARYTDSEGRRSYLTDYQLSTDFLDGKFYGLDEQYIMNITNFVQDYLDGLIPEPNVDIVLPSFSQENILLLGNQGARAPRLEIVLSDINK